MSQHPTGTTFQPQPHKIKIPRTAASYTPATMDNDLRSQLNVQLLHNGHDKKIQDHLLYSLNAHPNNWPTQVQNRALALLRSGEVQTFPALLKQILDEVRKETALEPTKSSKSTDANGSSSSNGADSTTVQVNGGPAGKKTSGGANGTAAGAAGANPGPGEASNLHTNTSTSLAVPRAVVDDALKVTKEVLSTVCEFEEEEENGTT